MGTAWLLHSQWQCRKRWWPSHARTDSFCGTALQELFSLFHLWVLSLCVGFYSSGLVNLCTLWWTAYPRNQFLILPYSLVYCLMLTKCITFQMPLCKLNDVVIMLRRCSEPPPQMIDTERGWESTQTYLKWNDSQGNMPCKQLYHMKRQCAVPTSYTHPFLNA